jgi:hypothetical protein
MLVTAGMMSILRAACADLSQQQIPDRREQWISPDLTY